MIINFEPFFIPSARRDRRALGPELVVKSAVQSLWFLWLALLAPSNSKLIALSMSAFQTLQFHVPEVRFWYLGLSTAERVSFVNHGSHQPKFGFWLILYLQFRSHLRPHTNFDGFRPQSSTAVLAMANKWSMSAGSGR